MKKQHGLPQVEISRQVVREGLLNGGIEHGKYV
jgi:hypothetical protein